MTKQPVDLRRLASDPAAFRNAIAIDCDGVATPFSAVVEPWQSADFSALDPAWRRLVGQQVVVDRQWQWCERSRGHSKSTDLGVSVAWALFASRHPLQGYAIACDLDQSKILHGCIEKLTRLNPWLKTVFDVTATVITNKHTGSTVRFLPADSRGAYGLTPDFLLLDEVTHWVSDEMWTAVVSAIVKRKRCVTVAITNAGWKTSWVWPVREGIRQDPAWIFSRQPGSVASWITPDRLAAQERLLSPQVYRRLWLNEWSDASGDGLNYEDVDAAVDVNLVEGPVPGEVYAAGLDLAVSRDNSALAIIGKDSHGRLALRRLRVWRPPAPGRKMDLQAIEDSVIADLAEFKVKMCAVDPSQAQHMVQRIARAGGRIEVRYQGAKTLREQACELQTAFRDRTLAIPDDAMLRRELLRIRLVETAHGSIRLVAERAKDGTGHADSCTAISLALAVAAPIRGGRLGPLVAACDSSHDDRVWAMQQKLAAADARVAASLTAVDRLRRLGEKPLHLIEGPDTTRHNFSIDRLL